MTSKEIYQLSREMSNQDVLNVVAGWERDNEKESLATYKSLVRLGDSPALACATTIAEKINKKDNSEFYNFAYRS